MLKDSKPAQAIIEGGTKAAAYVADMAGRGYNIAKESKPIQLLKEGATTAVEAAGKGLQAIKESQPVQAVVEAAGKAKDWALGDSVKKYESGNAGAAAVSTGKGDLGGASYGTYQLSSSKGRVQEFLKKSPYGAEFEGLTPGSQEFNAKWKELGASDKSFGQAQHQFIKETHYDPAMAALKKKGIDLSGADPAVKDMLWSTSVQFGPGSDKKGGGAPSLISNALKGKSAEQMSGADMINAVQDYKVANNSKLFASSSETVRAGTLRRADAERMTLLAGATQTASNAGLPSVASNLSMPPVAAPESAPSNANSSDRGFAAVSVTMARPKVGQVLSDRKIAHIATGGLSRKSI